MYECSTFLYPEPASGGAFQKRFSKHFALACNFYQKRQSGAGVFMWVFKKFFTEHLRATASLYLSVSLLILQSPLIDNPT